MEHEGKLGNKRVAPQYRYYFKYTHNTYTIFFKWQSTKLHQKRGVLI